MRATVVDGRFQLVVERGLIDVHIASSGRFGPSIDDVLHNWHDFLLELPILLAAPTHRAQDGATDGLLTGSRQVFAVGLNYRQHALESGLPLPTVPLVFTKYPSSLGSPRGTLELPTDAVDWEVELAVVVGPGGRNITPDEAWAHIAGFCLAQDYSARDVQMAGGSAPQFSLGKSFRGFLPLGPFLVTPDEFADRNDIPIGCSVNGVLRQSSSTADLVFDVAELVAYLSRIVELHPGDVILTGTPSGVGLGMRPPTYLRPGDVVETHGGMLGDMRHDCVAGDPPFGSTS
jgi:2-keto-4-pentenoate hydratase/2-oxohepta-3-ene-1,7-dioic acid hydratase in catechol pathway